MCFQKIGMEAISIVSIINRCSFFFSYKMMFLKGCDYEFGVFVGVQMVIKCLSFFLTQFSRFFWSDFHRINKDAVRKMAYLKVWNTTWIILQKKLEVFMDLFTARAPWLRRTKIYLHAISEPENRISLKLPRETFHYQTKYTASKSLFNIEKLLSPFVPKDVPPHELKWRHCRPL